MRSARIASLATAAALTVASLTAGTAAADTTSASSSSSPSAPAGAWCWPVGGQYHEVGPIILTSSKNTTRQDVCGDGGFGSWWRGINGSKDVVKLLSVQLADNFYFLVHAQGDLANSLGGVFKPVGNWDNSQFRK